MRGKCTLVEAKTVLTVDDIADLNEMLDLEDSIEAEQDRLSRQT